MRKFILSIALAGSALTATPALAQNWGSNHYDDRRGGYGQDYRVQLQRVGLRIDRGIQSGQISRREAYALRREYNGLLQLDRRLRYDGLTRWERQTLTARTQALVERVRGARGNGYGYGGGQGYDRDDRYDHDGRYDRGDRHDRDDRYDRDND